MLVLLLANACGLVVVALWVSRPTVSKAKAHPSLHLNAGKSQGSARFGQVGYGMELDTKSDCLYAPMATIASLSLKTGHRYDCALVFNNAVSTWSEWDTPFFEQDPQPDLNWAKWVAAVRGRRLIITEDMVPSGSPSDWREIGATGAYDSHATTRAKNLVHRGLGNSIIRLGHELNYTSPIASVGSGPVDYAAWVAYWQHIVKAMRAVPGAHFLFDWNINAGEQDIPFNEIYPGNSYVDIISVDQYDTTVDALTGDTPQQHWQALWNQPDGIASVLAFAAAKGKPTAFPEWGLAPAGPHGYGDDRYYISQMATLVADNNVTYQSYFYAGQSASLLTGNSMAQYITDFGGNGTVQGRPLSDAHLG